MKQITMLAVLLVCTARLFAIEAIQVSVQASNAVLSWPSLTNETYITQYRHTLNSTDAWITLTNYLPAAQNTNITFFIHSNAVDYGTVGNGGGTNSGGGGSPNPGGTNDSSSGNSGTQGIAGTGFYRVVRDGVHMWGITNGMVVSNVLVTSIEFAVNSTDQVVGVTLYDTNSGSPIIGASARNAGGSRWLIFWNTLQSFNGNYAVTAELDFASDEPVMSQPVAVTVSNVISFPNYFSQIYGNQLWIYAATIPGASYQLDIYDENTNYVGSFNGNADNGGAISFLWNFVDGNGVTHDDTNFVGTFTVSTTGMGLALPATTTRPRASASFLVAGPLYKTPYNTLPSHTAAHPNAGSSSAVNANQLWVKEGRWSPNNNWVICYASLTGDVTVDQRAIVTVQVV